MRLVLTCLRFGYLIQLISKECLLAVKYFGRQGKLWLFTGEASAKLGDIKVSKKSHDDIACFFWVFYRKIPNHPPADALYRVDITVYDQCSPVFILSPRVYTHSLGSLSTLNMRSSLEPFSGACMYCQRAVNGKLMRMLSTLDPGVFKPKLVPRSCTRLNST